MGPATEIGPSPRGASDERTTRSPVEWPTVALIALVYGGWLALTLRWESLPIGFVAPAGAVLLTLHGSLQHEILHGHPTRWRRLNRLLGIAPLSLWLPYERYRQTHLVHHVDARLTDPLDDPESYYWTPDEWSRLNPICRVFARIHATLAGRLLLGPFWSVARFWRAEAAACFANRGRARKIWLEHLIWCVPVVAWLTLVCRMPLPLYIFAMIVPGISIQSIRSFAEHRAKPGSRERTAIVERAWILGPLFLFNNLHSVHHDDPKMPWYEYNARFRARRAEFLLANGGLVYRGYADVARRYLFWPHDAPEHPMGRIPRER